MATPSEDTLQDVRARAAHLASRLPEVQSIAEARPQLQALLERIRELEPRFAFDADGRPAAIAAVRHALPSMERDLLDAVLEDHACEVAALEEAIFQLVRALRDAA